MTPDLLAVLRHLRHGAATGGYDGGPSAAQCAGAMGEVERMVAENGRLREALEGAAERFADLAQIVAENGSYSNGGFLSASAARYRSILAVTAEKALGG